METQNEQTSTAEQRANQPIKRSFTSTRGQQNTAHVDSQNSQSSQEPPISQDTPISSGPRQPTIKYVRVHNKDIYILGTAHISQESVEDVKTSIQTVSPDLVAIELDENRRKRLENEVDPLMSLNIFNIIKQKKSFFLFASILLSSFQRKLGGEHGTTPGAEMLEALQQSRDHNIPFACVDRPVEMTLRRIWGLSSFWGKNKLLASIVASIFSKENISKEELEELREKSLQGQIMDELSHYLPSMKQVLVDERDSYIATHVLSKDAHTILLIVGAAHVPGIAEKLEQLALRSQEERDTLRTDLEKIPQKKRIPFLPYCIPALIISLFVLGFFREGAIAGVQNVFVWFLVNGGLCALGAVIALAHPVTILTSFVAAPFTSINPFMGAGIVAGLVQASIVPPKGEDVVKVVELQFSIKQLYANRVSRTLIVVIMTTIGSAIGTFIGISYLATNV